MEPFKTVDNIFRLLKDKSYGQVTDKMVADGIKTLTDISADGSQNIKNNVECIRLYMSHIKAHRFDRVGGHYGENVKKLDEIKEWYVTKQNSKVDMDAYSQKDIDAKKENITKGRVCLSVKKQDSNGHSDHLNLDSQDFDGHNSAKINDGDGMTTEQRSREASKKLLKGNPNIANLSDSNRPSRLAERYSELYDNEWTEAFIYNSKRSDQDDLSTIQLLLNIVLNAYDTCYKTAEEDLKLIEVFIEKLQVAGKNSIDMYQLKNFDQIVNTDLGYLRQQRKSTADLAVSRVIQEFKRDHQEMLENTHGTPIEIYTDRCVELCWWMCVQDPPIFMWIPRGGVQDKEFASTLYRPYTKSGKTMDFLLWPTLLLYEDGPVLVKGLVQCK